MFTWRAFRHYLCRKLRAPQEFSTRFLSNGRPAPTPDFFRARRCGGPRAPGRWLAFPAGAWDEAGGLARRADVLHVAGARLSGSADNARTAEVERLHAR